MTTTTANEFMGSKKSTNVRVNNGAPFWLQAGFRQASALAPGLTSAVAARLFGRTQRSSPRPGERDVLQSAERFRVAGMQLWSWGEGPTVLLVHGWNGRATQLGGFVAPLTARGYRVVAFDAIGQVVVALGGAYAIVAHSLGGAATTFALSKGLLLQRAVFISPPADPREFLKFFGAALGIDDEVRRRVKERVERRLGIQMEDMTATAIAPSMQIPLLVIHDENDKEVPVDAGRRIAQAWPGATLTVTNGLGHQRILRDERVRDAAASFVDAERQLKSAA